MIEKIKSQVDNLPDAPGVYFFRQGRQILYIGKATSLRSRVRSYWRSDLTKTRSAWIATMIEAVDTITHLQTDSVLEALILESEQIKKHQPPYNSREKDDKSYLYVLITDEEFPAVVTLRGAELKLLTDENKPRAVFGPFPHGGELREALKIVRKIFPFRTTCQPRSGKLCFDAQLGLCPGVCGGIISPVEYRRLIRHLILFFRGKKATLLSQLERQMKAAARQQNFEQAEIFKRRIFALKHIQDVSLLRRRDSESRALDASGEPRFEAYDVAHISGTSSVGSMVVAYGHSLAKDQYRKFKLRGAASGRADDTANLYEVLTRRLTHPEWPLPSAVVVDGGIAQANVANRVLRDHGLTIPVISIVKDERHRPRGLSGPASLIDPYKNILVTLNAEAHRFALNYHRRLRGVI